jgi:hypothetical protein
LVALTVVVAMPVMGMAGVASAKAAKKGSSTWCTNHPVKALSTPGCPTYTGGAGGGKGAPPPPTITVTESPGSAADPGGVPLVETGTSEVVTVVQVETDAGLANDSVTISSTQLAASCLGDTIEFGSLAPSAVLGTNEITVPLDNDGNATVLMGGTDCAPGTDIIEADLTTAPYYTALDTMTVSPPAVTTPGLTGYPNDEVETGDDALINGLSDVYAVFYVEDSPVYAEQLAEIGSSQLEARCGNGWEWVGVNDGTTAESTPPPPNAVNPGPNTGAEATSVIDDDGNAAFVFVGASCAAGDSQVIADIEAGTHDTWTFDYTIDPPAVTI